MQGQSSCCQSMTLWTRRIARSHYASGPAGTNSESAAHFLHPAGLSRSCRRNASGDTEGSCNFPEARVGAKRTAFDGHTAEGHPAT